MKNRNLVAITDFHVHMGFLEELRFDIRSLLDKVELQRDYSVKNLFGDPMGLANYLSEVGVQRAVILAENGPGTNYHITTDLICRFSNIARDHGVDCFVPFGNINPRQTPDVLLEYRRARILGIKGIKQYPSEHSFDPNSRDFFKVYEAMEEDGLILMFHTGNSAQDKHSDRFCNPLCFEEIIRHFPGLTVVLAHAGKKDFHKEAEKLAREYSNCYLDTAFLSAQYLCDVFPDIEEFSQKIIYGSDWPPGISSYRKHLDEFFESQLSDTALKNILCRNSDRILGCDLKKY